MKNGQKKWVTMERANRLVNKRGRPLDPKSKAIQLVWLGKGGKTEEPAAAGRGLEVVLQPEPERDNDGRKGDNGGSESENKASDDTVENAEKWRRQFPIKLEFKIAIDMRLFNCAMRHRERFDVVKCKDPSARIIMYKVIAIKEVKDFPETQDQYNKAFPQRMTKQPGQPRAAEIVFEIETRETFQTLKTYNPAMMEFLNKNGVYMKVNIVSALRRDLVGFFTHIHPRATWRVEFQDMMNQVMREQMSTML